MVSSFGRGFDSLQLHSFFKFRTYKTIKDINRVAPLPVIGGGAFFVYMYKLFAFG